MDWDGLLSAAMQIAVAALVAVLLSPVVQGVTRDLDQSVGRVWPFSLVHCQAASTPGCGPVETARDGGATR